MRTGSPVGAMLPAAANDASRRSSEMLDAFCVAGTYDHVGARVRDVHAGQVDTLTLDVPNDESHDNALARLVSELRAVPGR